MKKALISIFIFSGILIAGLAAAQDNAAPGSQPPNASQSTNPAQPQVGQQMPEQPSPGTTPQTGAAQSGSSTMQGTVAARIAPGSVIPVELAKTIDAKKVKTGDEVVAKVTQDLKNNSGEVIIAKDTKVMGHVTEAQARNKEQKESQLGIAFDKTVPKNGAEIQMPMSIQAIIGPQNSTNNPGGGNSEAVPSSAGGGNPTAGARPGMAGSASSPSQPAPGGDNLSSDSQTASNSRPPITGETKGVIGIPNLTLNDNASQGSLLTSEKNNVKLESGTMMLLRVNQ